jgi:cytochrome c553
MTLFSVRPAIEGVFKTMRTWVGVVALGLAGCVAAAAQAQESVPQGKSEGNAEAGAAKAGVCLACHGLNGNSAMPENPSLAGQHATYTAKQLRLFKSGERNNPIMMPMAQPLSDQDILDLAEYYSEQTPAGLEADPSYWKDGEKLYRAGDAQRQVPACIACHGPVGRGNDPATFPALRAQHAVYTRKQLIDYAEGKRYAGSTPQSEHAKMMTEVAARLTPEDIRNVSSYIQGMR